MVFITTMTLLCLADPGLGIDLLRTVIGTYAMTSALLTLFLIVEIVKCMKG